MLELIELVLWRVPESAIVNGGNGEILSDSLDPSGDSIDALP